MSERPTIGVLMDYEAAGSFSKRPHYALRTAYFDAVWRAGGTPVALPYMSGAIPEFLARCDGVITPGGSYPFPPAWYGKTTDPGGEPEPRFRFEIDLTRAVIDGDVPTLGICAGMQVMAGVLGGVFYQDVCTEVATTIDHLNERPAEEPAHGVRIVPDTLLRRIVGCDEFSVNTAHREALRIPPDGLVVNAVAPDGVIEGIEMPGKRFMLGVQWHPEFFLADGNPNFALFEALVETAGRAK
ncbi:MAG: gamma-glutamyl-gamma-aminobutyrate hydrolase family protein [Rhodospirillales bacterium]